MPKKVFETKDLVEAESPISFVDIPDGAETENGLYIKGFVSVERRDRVGDVVGPDAFDVPQFMATPTLLVQHEFWRDASGNQVSVGVPKSMNPAELVPLKDDPSSWGIKDLKTKELINTYPKVLVPNLKSGDKGLFMVALITEKGVIEQIKKRQLNAFSWRGFSTSAYEVNIFGVDRRIKSVGLVEISLVNAPVQQDSSFMMGKSIYSLSLNKNTYKSAEEADDFIKKYNFVDNGLCDNGECLTSSQGNDKLIDITKLEIKSFKNGIKVVAGPMRDAFLKDISDQLQKEEAETMADEQKQEATNDFSKLLEETLKGIDLKIDEKFKALGIEEIKTSIASLTENQSGISDLKEQVSQLVKSLEKNKEEATKESAAAEENTNKEAAKGQQDDIKSLKDIFGQILEEAQKKADVKIEELSKSVKALLESTSGTETTREEKLKSDTKGQKKAVVGDLFNNLMPFKVSSNN